MLLLTIFIEDIGLSDTEEYFFETKEDLQHFMSDKHGFGDTEDGFQYEEGVPYRYQYDETYFKIFTVTTN